MLFASRTRQRVKITVLVIAAFAAIIGVLAVVFPQKGGTFSESFVWWLVGVPLGLVVWFSLEWCGTTLLGFSFWQKMPNGVCVALLVAIIVAVVIAVMLSKQFAYAL